MLDIIKRIDNTLSVMFSVYEIDAIEKFLINNQTATVIIDSTYFDNKERHGFPNTNLEILKGLPIRKLCIMGSWCENYDGISNLEDLEYLDVSYVSNFKFDFTKNKNLKHLELIWSKEIKNIYSLTELEYLKILKYKSDNKELAEFSKFLNLKRLIISQSNIKSIKGIEDIEKLNELQFAYCKDLKSEMHRTIFPQVRILSIEKCPKIEIGFLEMFPCLEELNIQNQPEIKKLKPILDIFPKMRKLHIGGTNIAEVDNRYWLDYHNIGDFYFSSMKHHVLSSEEITQYFKKVKK